MKDKHRPLLERQPPEGTVELVTVVDGQNVGRFDAAVHAQHTHLGPHPSVTPGLGVALVSEDSVKPCFKGVGIAQRPELTPRADQRGLHRIVSPVGVTQDPERDRHALIAHVPSEGIEGLSVAPSRTFDERSVHPTLPLAPRQSDGITLQRAERAPKVPPSPKESFAVAADDANIATSISAESVKALVVACQRTQRRRIPEGDILGSNRL